MSGSGLIENLRQCIRQVLEPSTRTVLSEETVTRAQYYLPRVLYAKTNPNVDEASQLRAKAQTAMERLIELSPRTFDIDAVEESILYDYLVAGDLRISIFQAGPEKPKKESSFVRMYSRFVRKGPFTIHSSQSTWGLSLSNMTGGHSASTESVALTLPNVETALED